MSEPARKVTIGLSKSGELFLKYKPSGYYSNGNESLRVLVFPTKLAFERNTFPQLFERGEKVNVRCINVNMGYYQVWRTGSARKYTCVGQRWLVTGTNNFEGAWV